MRKSSNTGDGAVLKSRNRSSAISNGSRSENASGIRAMNGCGELLAHVWISTFVVVYSNSADNSIAPNTG